MELILVRHGNTFEKGDPVFWVGAKEDLPLASFATVQAERVAAALSRLNKMPTVIYSGALQRTHVFATLIRNTLKLSCQPEIDVRLNEVDYGGWGGKTREELIAQGNEETLNAWEKEAKWPKTGWGESEEEVRARIHTFARDITSRHTEEEIVLLVSSNGCLRYFLELIPHAFNQHIAENRFKVATGHCCHLLHDASGWRLQTWNQDPTAWTE